MAMAHEFKVVRTSRLAMKQVVDAILETYRKNWRSLEWEKQRHLAFRLAVLSPNSSWPSRFHSLTPKTLFRLRQLVAMNQRRRLEFARLRLAGLKLEKTNRKTKADFILRHPQELYFHTLLFDLFYSKNTHPRLMKEAIQLALTREAVSADPAWAINTFCLAAILGGPNRIAQGMSLFRQAYPSGVNQNQDGATNYAYGVTHWIIGGTNFYTRRLPLSHPGTAFLSAATKGITRLESADIAAEILLCLKITGQDQPAEIIHRIAKQILLTYDWTRGRLVRESSDSFNRAEHRNVMTIMAHNFREPSDPRQHK